MWLLGACAAGLCSLGFPGGAYPIAAIASEPFAQSQPTESTLKPPRKWTQVRGQIEQEAQCLADTDASCARGMLAAKMAEWRTLSRGGRIMAVNHWINTFDYDSDIKAWGQSDYWSPLSAFVVRGKGDCEDFAIAKYTLLRSLGVAGADLRLIIVSENKRGQLHALLSVRQGSDWLLLDNMQAQPRRDIAANDYRPVMQMSDSGTKYYAGIDPMTFVQPAARRD